MQKYEITFLFDKKHKDFDKELEKMLESVKAKVIKKDDWGVKKLSYPIMKLTEAAYVFFEVEINPKKIADLNTKIRLEERIIRELIVRV